MKAPVFMALLLASVGVHAIDLSACGDKFYVPGRVARVKPKVDRQAAAVLIFARDGTPLGEAMRSLSIEQSLRTSGYRPVVATSPDEVARRLQERQWDVVVAGILDVADVSATRAAETASLVLIGNTLSGTARDGARRTVGRVFPPPTRPQAMVDAIDGVFLARAKARKKRQGARGTTE